MVQLIAGKKGDAITQMGEFAATGENGDEKNRGRKRMQGCRGLSEPGRHPVETGRVFHLREVTAIGNYGFPPKGGSPSRAESGIRRRWRHGSALAALRKRAWG